MTCSENHITLNQFSCKTALEAPISVCVHAFSLSSMSNSKHEKWSGKKGVACDGKNIILTFVSSKTPYNSFGRACSYP